MSRSKRAKIFQPFDALRGLREAIATKERIPTPRKCLTEDAVAQINNTLIGLKKGQFVTVVYYGAYEQDYLQLTGPVTSVDPYWRSLQVGNTAVAFSEIDQLITDADSTAYGKG